MRIYETTESDKEKLREPRGDVFKGKEVIEALKQRDYSKIIAVGDRVSFDLEESDIEVDLSIVDGNIERKELEDRNTSEIKAEKILKTQNPAGGISKEAWTTTRKACSFNCKTKVVVNGEEDLMALPATLFSRKDAAIVYGLWDTGAVVMEAGENKEFVQDLIDLEKANHLIVGGSWDHLHAGHRYILLTALEGGKKVDIGVSSDEMLREKLGKKPANNFEQRKNAIKTYLQSLGEKNRARIIEINDIYGNAVEQGDTLLVTPETEENGRKINTKREELGRKKLKLDKIKKLEAEDGKVISSTRIRKGEIDENGLLN